MHSKAVKPAQRVVLVSLYYWPEKAGSAPPVQQMAEVLAAAGHQIEVLTARPAYPEMAVYPAYRDGSQDREQHQGVTIERIPQASYQPGGGLRSRLATESRFALRAWWRLIRRPRADVVIAVCPSILAVLAVRLACSGKTTRRLAVVHDLQSGLAKSLGIARQPRIARLIEGLERRALQPMARIVTLSESMAQSIRNLGITVPISIVPPTVDDDLIRPQPEQSGTPRLLYSGNIGRKQGLDQLIDLAGVLQQRGLEATLIIRGDGNYRETLERHAKARALTHLRFEPLCPADRLAEGLAEGHIHLVPQDPAGAAFAVPSKIYSIMAAGRPFVCTAEPGSPLEALRAESDAFVTCPPNQPASFAELIERLIADPAERARLGRNGRAYVEQHAGRNAAARAYGELIAEPPGAVSADAGVDKHSDPGFSRHP
ncbi:MAG: glycosyltransferase family 4 protein [Lamprobacter sp.]|uniref:glycosyltransferase family 4 protein n=1 Tax=Lamprobacter sp. TaxID=3100796 RepID=UPI002B25EEBD|nr:glycosyltransferase family 4 protein [Lamprobacter sp.]MEA3641097.1 glycosyltransferase family 4 protein [Lamprobacter sp.]